MPPLPLSLARVALALGLLHVAAVASAAQTSTAPLAGVDQLLERAARPSWQPQGEWLAFDRPGSDGLHDLWLWSPETGAERCLTCPIRDLGSHHNLAATWHPSGELLVFLSQANARRLGLSSLDLTTPERGLRADLWVIRADGSDFLQLTRAGEQGSALLDPRFSPERGRLAWSERVASREGRWGSWQAMVADVRANDRVVRLRRPQRIGGGGSGSLIVVQEFSPDERALLVSGNLDRERPESSADLWRLPLGDGGPERLTDTLGHVEEFAHLTPRGDRLIYTSNAGIFPRPTPRVLSPELLRELWIARPDGTEARRLTWFNDPARPQGPGEAWLGDFSFRREGDRLAIHVVSVEARQPVESVWEIRLDESLGRE